MLKSTLLLLGSLLLVIFACQPNQEKTALQPEETEKEKKKVTIKDVDQGIRANIAARTKDGGGYFNFQKDTLDLSLKLVRVHTEYLSILGRNEFFACVDLATENGDVYDMDFFLTGAPGDMQVTKTDLHKLNGKPYYTWKKGKDKTWFTVPVQNASNDLLGVLEGKDQFTFTYEVQLPEISGPANIWLPVAQSDRFQTIDLVSLEAPGKQEMIKDDEYGNTIMYLQLLPEHSSQKIIMNYQVERKEKAAYQEQHTNIEKYLEASTLMPVGDRFSTIADEVIREKQANSPLTKARALYDYIIDNMRYAKEGTYGTGDANYACDSKSGNCTEFHSFFISLARSAGIPARFAVGAAIPSERNDGEVDGYHCWAEFYAEGKWWPVDISEANKYTPLATYYFGHHPANRIEFSQGRDLAPDPTPQSGPINFLAYPVLEIEGKPGYAKTTLSFNRVNLGS
ncbi:MAG: transglutaminase-like domain-containing protein [Cyclobacteriaceae bacterium]